jgi:hypothetical protein
MENGLRVKSDPWVGSGDAYTPYDHLIFSLQAQGILIWLKQRTPISQLFGS